MAIAAVSNRLTVCTVDGTVSCPATVDCWIDPRNLAAVVPDGNCSSNSQHGDIRIAAVEDPKDVLAA